MQAAALMDDLDGGLLICSYKLIDMVYSDLLAMLPPGFEMLLMASQRQIQECYGNNLVCLSMPLKSDDLIASVRMILENRVRQRRKKKEQPRERSEDEKRIIENAKDLLISRNHMTEEEAHRYLQRTSMENGTSMKETAEMVLTLLTGR